MRRRCVPAPAAVGGASLHRGCRVPAAVVRPCTGFLAPPARPAPAVEIRKNDLEGVLRLEAVKSASCRVGGLLGRRDSSYSFVLIHCLFGTLQQFVDLHGMPWIEVCDSRAQRQRGKITAVRWPSAGTQHDCATRGVLRTRRQGGELI